MQPQANQGFLHLLTLGAIQLQRVSIYSCHNQSADHV
jgi:hypothetical protein